MIILNIVLIIAGSIFIFDGLKLLLKDGYAEKKYNVTKADNLYSYSKYGRGVFSLIFGIIMVTYVILSLIAN